ncbi:MAG: O-antigen ligase family protein, partial [Candidatus Omnitrophota bacterium]
LMIVASSMFATILFSQQESKRAKVLLTLMTVITLGATVMTAMRASFVGLIAFFLMISLHPRYGRQVWRLSLIPLLAIAVTVFLYEPMRSKLFITASFISRLYLWRHALALWGDHVLFGIGLNHFQYTFPRHFIHDGGFAYFDAHSLYLQVASQQGLFGLLSLLVILGGYLYYWRKIKGTTSLGEVVKYASLGGFCVTFVSGIFDTTLHHEHAIAFTTLTGLLLAHSGRWTERKQ